MIAFFHGMVYTIKNSFSLNGRLENLTSAAHREVISVVPESILSRIVHNYEMLDAIRQRKNIDFTVETLRDDLNISRTTADKCIAVLKDEKDEKTFQTKTVEYPLITKHEKRTVILNDAALFLGISVGTRHTRFQLLGLNFDPYTREQIKQYPYLKQVDSIESFQFEEDEADEFGFSYLTPVGGENTFENTRRLVSTIISCFLKQAEAYYAGRDSAPFPLMGVGLAVTGPVNYKKQLWRSAPRGFTAVRDIELMELIGYENQMLAQTMGIFLSIDNNAKTAMISEYQYLLEKNSSHFNEDIALIYLGSGIGSAAVIDKKLLRGSQNVSGEVGYLQIAILNRDGTVSSLKSLEEHLIGSENAEEYQQFLPYILNTINCVLGIDRVILVGHSIRKNDKLIPSLMEQRMRFTVTSTQHYCKLETGRNNPNTAAMGAAIESYISMCHYNEAQADARTNLANEITW